MWNEDLLLQFSDNFLMFHLNFPSSNETKDIKKGKMKFERQEKNTFIKFPSFQEKHFVTLFSLNILQNFNWIQWAFIVFFRAVLMTIFRIIKINVMWKWPILSVDGWVAFPEITILSFVLLEENLDFDFWDGHEKN